MGQIQDAQKTIDGIQGEIDAIRHELQQRRVEIAPLSHTFDPDGESRRAALRTVIDRLEAKLTPEDHEPGSNELSLSERLRQAKARLLDLRKQRRILAADIERIEARAVIVTKERYDKALAGLLELDRLMRDCNLLDSNAPLRGLAGPRAWLGEQRRQIDSLPHLQKRLEDLGPAD